MALSASIFLVGCLNLANLQLARLQARAHELSVRMALGASSGRLIRQIVIEDALLVAGGSVCAFVLGRAASGVLVRWASNRNSLFTFDLHPNLPLAALRRGADAAFAAVLQHSSGGRLHPKRRCADGRIAR